MRWYDSDNGDCCSKISAFLMKKTTVICHKSAQTCKKTPKNEDNRMHFFTKKGYFCVNECKTQNICHTFLAVNPFI